MPTYLMSAQKVPSSPAARNDCRRSTQDSKDTTDTLPVDEMSFESPARDWDLLNQSLLVSWSLLLPSVEYQLQICASAQ